MPLLNIAPLTPCLLGLLLQDGMTPMHVAAGNNHAEVVRQLLAAGAAVDAKYVSATRCKNCMKLPSAVDPNRTPTLTLT
jgi:ankyrin repeat protein